jgi:hypothetical protein
LEAGRFLTGTDAGDGAVPEGLVPEGAVPEGLVARRLLAGRVAAGVVATTVVATAFLAGRRTWAGFGVPGRSDGGCGVALPSAGLPAPGSLDSSVGVAGAGTTVFFAARLRVVRFLGASPDPPSDPGAVARGCGSTPWGSPPRLAGTSQEYAFAAWTGVSRVCP